MPRLPEFESPEEFAEFVETHDTADYESELEPVADVRVDRAAVGRQRLMLELLGEALYRRVQEIAERQQVEYEVLIREWVAERARKHSPDRLSQVAEERAGYEAGGEKPFERHAVEPCEPDE